MNNHVTVLEIDANAVLHNLNYFKQKLNPETKILAVVKAFGYGSDAVEIAKILENKVDYFAVAYSCEGIALRKAGIKLPIIVLYPQKQNMRDIVNYLLEPNLYSFELLDAFLDFTYEEEIKGYPIHIEFNTGLNRLGFSNLDVPRLVTKLKEVESLSIRSVFSHLVASEDLGEVEFTNNQINTYKNIIEQFTWLMGYRPTTHMLNTSGVVNYSDTNFDMVRVGIGIYGFGNHPEVTSRLKNVFTLKSVISQIHSIGKGETVGYNRAFCASKPIKSATIPVGHADGISRKLGNKNGYVTINNKIAPIIGNVCMDIIMVDVSGIDCKAGDEVIIFNHQDQINYIADKCETISYEILTGLSQRIKRVIKK
ncbi:MAG: alanine racemase [Tenacibaculum sp.]|nr:alanine racemase [Tenacibaculum sp.]